MPNGEPVAVFNGSNQYVTVPSNAPLSIPTTGNFTWEMWIQRRNLQLPADANADHESLPNHDRQTADRKLRQHL
jgi:hypothetical protein